MPALLLSDNTSALLRALASEDSDEEALSMLRIQLNSPIKPAIEGGAYPSGTIIEHQWLVRVAKWAAERKGPARPDLSLSSLLKGAQVAVPIKMKPVRSPELIETLRRIQLAKDQAEYNEMIRSDRTGSQTKSVPFGFRSHTERKSVWSNTTQRTEAEEWDEVRRQIGAIINVGLSVAAVATATWWAAGNADPIWKTLVAIPLSLLVAVAEIVLYARHWDNVQKKREKAPKR